jgi:hypothetical protein
MQQKLNLNHFNPVAFEEVSNYHQQRYQEHNMVVCDDDFKVIFEGYKPKNREK